MPFIFTSKGQQTLWATQSNMIPSAITGLTAASTVAGQITLTWSGGLGNKVKYSYALSNNTNPIASVGAIAGNGVGTPYSVTLTLTTTNSITTTVTLTASVLGGSTSAISGSVTTYVNIIPSAVSVNGLPTLYYPLSVDMLDYANNTSSGVNDTTNNGATIDTTNKYKTGISGSLSVSETSNYYLQLPTINVGSSGFTIAMWFMPKSTVNSCLFGFYVSNSSRIVPNTTGSIINAYFSTGGGDLTATYSLSVNTWVHLAWVFSNSSSPALLYVNNSPITIRATSTYTGWSSSNYNFIGHGVYNGGTIGSAGGATGNVNNFYFFNRPLSQTEITALYAQ